MKLDERPAAMMKMVGGRLCLDFVNTAGGRRADLATGPPGVSRDSLKEYDDLAAWGFRAGLLTEAEARALARLARGRAKAAAGVLNRARNLREAIYRICKAVIDARALRRSDLDLLNAEIDVARGHERLVDSKGNFKWEWDAAASALDYVLWHVADSAAELLTAGDLSRLRECGGENCGWLFEDTSRNRTRQWCVMQDCGNIAKVRRFRQRKK
ncbi:MAG TPA: ABATE domain-containing protein [Blastocatellia bacterium]|jgi:predicted RNA-binding Zn ribbon-like protein